MTIHVQVMHAIYQDIVKVLIQSTAPSYHGNQDYDVIILASLTDCRKNGIQLYATLGKGGHLVLTFTTRQASADDRSKMFLKKVKCFKIV